MNLSNITIRQFLDEEGRIIKFPAKLTIRIAVLSYLAEKFEVGKKYKEKEVNDICDRWHTFKDFFILRRNLVEEKFLIRETDGSFYWRNEDLCSQYPDEEENRDE